MTCGSRCAGADPTSHHRLGVGPLWTEWRPARHRRRAGSDINQNGVKTDDDYGAIYRFGAANSASTAVIHFDSQQASDPWAKAGLVIRNDPTKAHKSPGYVTLVATHERAVTATGRQR